MGSEGRQIDGDILQGKADVLRAQQEGLGTEGVDDPTGRPATDGAPASATDAPSPSQTAANREKPLPAALRPLGAPIPHRAVTTIRAIDGVTDGVPSSDRAQETAGPPQDTTAPGPTASGPQEDTGRSDDSHAIDPEEQDLARRIRAALERVGGADHGQRPEPASPPVPASAPDANQPPAEGSPRSTSESAAAGSSGTSIPQLDLAEQILAEQRRMVAQRRQRNRPAGTSAPSLRGIRHVVQRIAGDTPGVDTGGPDRPPTRVRPSAISQPADGSSQGGGESQIARIVAADIARLYGQL